MSFDFKTASDGASIPTNAVLFGADSHASASPSPYPASLVTQYLPNGSGAIRRTIADKLQNIVDVFDYIPAAEWPAIKAYTSTTDLRAYLNAAINYVNLVNGTLVFGAGKFCFSAAIGVDGLNNVIFQGAGGHDLTYSGTVGTVLCYTGTGSGDVITMTNHKAVSWRDFQVVYTSDSYTGIIFNCNSTLSIGNGSSFINVQCYQPPPNSGNTALACYYLRNNVDVYFEHCYVSHAAYGWIGLFDSDVGETNVILLNKCTSIGLGTAAIVNPVIGWNMAFCNFELSKADSFGKHSPCGVISTASKSVLNIGFFGCICADATTLAGTWISVNNAFGFTWHGGGIVNEATPGNTRIGISFNGAFCSGISIAGALMSEMDIGIAFNCPTTGVTVSGCTFPNLTNPVSGRSNCDPGSRFFGNSPDFGSFFDNTGLRVIDSDKSHYLTFRPASNLTANRELTIATGDADVTLDLTSGGLNQVGSFRCLNATAVPAGGSTGAGYKFSSTPNLGVFFGSGAPTLSAAQGSLYIRTDGSSTSTRMYVNTNGTTGWTNAVTAT